MLKNKTILFLSYWSLREPLNASAVFPYLRLLSERNDIERIIFVTMETTTRFLPQVYLDIAKVEHVALKPRVARPYLLSRAFLFIEGIIFLMGAVRKNNVSLIISKASIAGAMADVVHSFMGTPYSVESFEPHSDYMLDCGVWKKRSLRYVFAHYMESRQIRNARHIITVTHNHRDDLIRQGVNKDRLKVIPSITDLDTFIYDAGRRMAVRQRLGIPSDSKVGIYVGKFGGLYLDQEAFTIFAQAIERFPEMHILVLSPSLHEDIRRKAHIAGIPHDRMHVVTAMHVEVPDYLSASDFAFSTIKPAPIKRYQCPIKNGEYWACGLPILMTDMVSDEHLLMRSGIGGAVYDTDLSNVPESLDRIARILDDPDHKEQMRELARRYRSIDIARGVYEETL
jgi:glycosyltransferase involved in cell wall biosynthesis